MDEGLGQNSWKRIFVRAAGAGFGAVLCVAVILGAGIWYFGRTSPEPPWNSDAIVARYADLYMTIGNRMVVTVRYTIENRSGQDYVLPSSENLYKVLADGKGLERDPTLKWDGGPIVPAGQLVNVGIQVSYDYEGSSQDTGEISVFTNRRLAEIEGFAMLDPVKRYDVRFPKPPGFK